MQIKITEEQATRFLALRTLPYYEKLQGRRALYREIRNDHGLPTSIRMRIAVENPNNPMYRVIRDKHSGLPLDDGRTEPTPAVKATSEKKPAIKATSEKKPAKAAPARTGKAVPSPAKTTPVRINKQTFSPTKTATHTVEVRTTINGVRQRLGYAVSEEVKAKVIAKAKKDAGM